MQAQPAGLLAFVNISLSNGRWTDETLMSSE